MVTMMEERQSAISVYSTVFMSERELHTIILTEYNKVMMEIYFSLKPNNNVKVT